MHSPLAGKFPSSPRKFLLNKNRYAIWNKGQKNDMRVFIFSLVCFLVFCLGSCSVVEGIFKAGMVWGIFLVVGFIALVIFIIAKVSGGRK